MSVFKSVRVPSERAFQRKGEVPLYTWFENESWMTRSRVDRSSVLDDQDTFKTDSLKPLAAAHIPNVS